MKRQNKTERAVKTGRLSRRKRKVLKRWRWKVFPKERLQKKKEIPVSPMLKNQPAGVQMKPKQLEEFRLSENSVKVFVDYYFLWTN